MDEVTEKIIGTAIEVHRILGPGFCRTSGQQASNAACSWTSARLASWTASRGFLC